MNAIADRGPQAMALLAKFVQYLEQARIVRELYGLSVFEQFREIALLSRGRGRISPGDYYTYRLFEPEISAQEKQKFVGWRTECELDALNDPRWHCLGLDKILMYGLFTECGLRVPETRAIYLDGRHRFLRGAASLTSKSELHEWLRNSTSYPFFSKPSASGFGRGAFFAISHDQASDTILFRDGSRVAVTEFCHDFRDIEHLGYLFQAPVKPDESLVPLIGNIPSSLRLMILMDEIEGPLLHRAFWKLPTGYNMCDNFNSGKTGNLAAAICHESGAVVRVITGIGLELTEAEIHPDTGVKLKSVAVPDWAGLKEFAFKAALTLPKLRFQQWDIALSNEGPLILEVNLFGTGGCDLTQLLYKKGLRDETMQRFLDRHAD